MFPGDRSLRLAVLATAVLTLTGACRQKMADQPSYTPLQASEFFDDGMSSRLPVAGTVAVGQLNEDEVFATGKIGKEFVDELPFRATMEVLQRGHERFEIYCSVCHGRGGDGDGMIVQRGYRKPPSFHSSDFRARPVGYYFDVMTNGFGVMPGYAGQVRPEDRWAIAAWIRVLQFSQNATLEDIPPSIRERLLGGEDVVEGGESVESDQGLSAPEQLDIEKGASEGEHE